MIYKPKFAQLHSEKKNELYFRYQQGVALIVVLLFLILIMLAGVMAVRQSHTDLKTATADQINTLLLQSSDSANERLESVVNGDPTSDDYKDILIEPSGLFAYFMGKNSVERANNEFVYCYNPRNRKYQLNTATVYVNKSSGTENNKGICDYTKGDSYTSDRQTVVTQVNVNKLPAIKDEGTFPDVAEGENADTAVGGKGTFEIRSTSAIPSYNTPIDTTDSKSCFAKTPTATATAGLNMLDCLHKTNTPSKMLYTQAVVEKSSKAITCVKFARAGSSVSKDTRCVVKQ